MLIADLVAGAEARDARAIMGIDDPEGGETDLCAGRLTRLEHAVDEMTAVGGEGHLGQRMDRSDGFEEAARDRILRLSGAQGRER